MTQSKEQKGEQNEEQSKELTPVQRLVELAKRIQRYTNNKPKESDTEKESSYVPTKHKKGLPTLSISEKNSTIQWKRYIEGEEYDKWPLVVPHRRVRSEDEEGGYDLLALTLTGMGGTVVGYHSHPDPSFFNEEKDKTESYCRYVGVEVYDPNTNSSAYVSKMPTAFWPSMYGFDKRENGVDRSKPGDDLPADVYGLRGQCRTCISNGHSTHTYESKGETKVAECRVRSWVYFYVTHFYAITPKQPIEYERINKKKLLVRSLREKGNFSGNIAKEHRYEVEVYRVEDLYDSNGEPLKPFIIGLRLPAAATRGKVTEGSVPIHNYAKVLIRQGLDPLSVYTVCHLNIPDGGKNPVPHFEPFGSDGESLYKEVKYNPFLAFGETVKKEIARVMEDPIPLQTDTGIMMVTQFGDRALAEWELWENEPKYATFDPMTLGYEEKEAEEEEEPAKTIPVAAVRVPNMKSAAPTNQVPDDAWNSEELELLGLDDEELS